MKLLTENGWKDSAAVNEEVEQVDEISKAKLAAYIPRAADNLSKKYHDMKLAYNDDGNFGNYDDNDTYDPEEGKKRERDVEKRRKGIDRAVSRLTKVETEQIDYEAFLEHVVMNYPELVEEFLSKQDNESE